MVSQKIRRKKKQSRRTHKYRRNNTKKKYRIKNKTRKLRSLKVMKGGSLESEVALLMTHSEERKVAAFANDGVFVDPYYKSEIIQEMHDPAEIWVSDNQKQAPEDKGDKYLSHYDLMLLENIIDIIHDVVAEGSLSYDAKLSLELIVKSYTAIYNYPEYNGWRLILLGLLDSELLEGVTPEEEQLIRTEQSSEEPEPDIKPLKDIFDRWIKTKEMSLSKSTGAGIELIFKNYLYKKNKNKYVIDPTYQKRGAIQMAILEDWDYANGSGKSLQVTPYGGGSLRNGIRLWEYILGRGNSYLDLDSRFTWVENTIEFPSQDDIENYEIDKKYALNFDIMPAEEKSSEKASHFLRYLLFYLYVFIRDIDTDNTLSVANKSSEKNSLYALYERLIATEAGERAYDEDPSVLYNLHINFTDAGDKPSSAVGKLYETMKLRESVYGNSSKYPVENKAISNIVDKATSSVGPAVSIKTFGDGRRPICDKNKYRDQFNEEILYDDILTQNFTVRQDCYDRIMKKRSLLTIRQELVDDENILDSKEFLEVFLDKYTGLLNDIRVLYHRYINTGNRKITPEQTQVNKEISTKDLIKLKFFHLMNYMVFLASNEKERDEIIAIDNLLNNIKGGIKKDFSESQCGQELDKGLKGWLKPFLSVSKPDNFQLKDHWDTWDGIIESEFFKKEAKQGIIPVEPKKLYNPKRRPAESKPAFQQWSTQLSLDGETTNGQLYDDYKRDKLLVKLESIKKIRSSPFYKIYKNVVAGEEIYNIAGKTFENERQQSFIASTTFDKGQKKYFQWSKVNQSNIINEYLSTGVVFNNLKNSIDVYNGWRVANLSACDASSNVREFDFVDEEKDSQYVSNILSLKGVCVRIKRNSLAKFKYGDGFMFWADLPNLIGMNELKLILRPSGPAGSEIYSLFILINRYNLDEESKTITEYYNNTVPVYDVEENPVKGSDVEVTNFIKDNFLKRTNITPGQDGLEKNTPDFLEITNFFKKGDLFPNQEKLEDYEYNLRFSSMAQRTKTTDDSGNHIYAASPESAKFWEDIGTLPNDECKKKIIEMINLIPNLFALLYNFILYDFDTPDTYFMGEYPGSRTTGKMYRADESIESNRHLKGDTFIQRGIKEAIHNFESMKNQEKGIQTINCYRPADDIEISFTSDNPSVTGVLTNVREYMIHYLLANNCLKPKTAKKIKPTFFRLDSRQNVEDKNTQELVNEILKLFMYENSQYNLSGKIKNEIGKNITNKIRDLPTHPDVKYIVIGLLLNHKTQGDEMQLHTVKALKELFPIDNDGLEVLYHCYSFDGVMGIKALRKGASLLFQSGRGVQISLAGKTEEIAWKRLEKGMPNLSEMKQDSTTELKEMMDDLLSEITYVDVKDPIQRTSINNNDPSINIKTWFQDNIAILYRDLTVSRIEDVTPSQLEINDLYQNLLDDYLNSIDCNFDILSRIKFKPFKDANDAINAEANKIWYINMDASFNTICSNIKASNDQGDLDSYITTAEAEINRVSQHYSVRYNVIDEDLEEIFNNIDSFQKSLIFFTSNITSIKENFQLQPFDEQEFYTNNVTSYLLARTILNHITFILSNKDNAEQLEMIKNRFKIIKVCLKFIMISITKEQVDLRTEVVPSTEPGVLTRGFSQTASDPQNLATPQRPRPTGNRSRVSSLDAGVSPPRAQQAQGATYPTVNFGEYLKLRIKKLEELANYMSSEIINLDTCKSLLENASKVPTLLGEGKLTQKYLLKDKTSVQSQIFVNKFMKKLGENLQEAGIFKNALGRVVDSGSSGFFSDSSSSDFVPISRAQYNEYLALKNIFSSDGAQGDGSSDGAQSTSSPMKPPPKKKIRR